MRKTIVILFISILLFSCKKENDLSIDVSSIEVDLKVARFEQDFYTSTSQTLVQTKEQYPMLFPHDNDSVWLGKINDKDERELFEETSRVYKDFSSQEKKLISLFKHIKHYFPKFKEPAVITMISNIDYENRVVYADSLLFVSLDAYLGKEHEFYNDYPHYIKQNNTQEYLIVDVAKAIVDIQFPPNTKRSFIDKIIYEGKKMYLLDAYLPSLSDSEKIGYSAEKFDWAINSEEEVWRYFISRNLLYSTDSKLNQRFLDVAPFSKFYLGEDNRSPGRIGVYIGWQIVRSFMRNNDVSLPQLIRMSEEDIFTKSKYKPKR